MKENSLQVQGSYNTKSLFNNFKLLQDTVRRPIHDAT